jgi:FixJ family two-component response regulator
LTDVVLPSGNGRDLANQLIKERPDLSVLFMTGYTRNAIVHNGTLDPGVRLLSKPFTLEDLSRELQAILADVRGPDSRADFLAGNQSFEHALGHASVNGDAEDGGIRRGY